MAQRIVEKPLGRLVAAHRRRGAGAAAADLRVEAAAGNPLYAQELARAVEPSGWVRIPERLQGLLDARLSALPERVLAVLAVLKDGFSAAEFASVAHTTPAAAEDLLEAAEMLEREGDGWRFTHPLLREAARRHSPAEALRRAHADAAAALERDGAPPERIAYHLLQAGRREDALPQLVAAARDAAAIGAYADGRRWVEQALLGAGEHRTSELHALLGELRAAAARALREGGRLAIADIVSARTLKERTRRNTQLWAACIAAPSRSRTTSRRSRPRVCGFATCASTATIAS